MRYCLASSLQASTEQAAQINFHVPSLRNTRGKSIFAFDGSQAIFRGLKLIQLWAALAAIHPLSLRTGTLASLLEQKFHLGIKKIKHEHARLLNCLCSYPAINVGEHLLTGSVPLCAGQSLQFRVVILPITSLALFSHPNSTLVKSAASEPCILQLDTII